MSRKPPSQLPGEPLTRRELEVLQLVGGGLTNRQIATRLFLSVHTIDTHVESARAKLRVHSRTAAVAAALAAGLIPVGDAR